MFRLPEAWVWDFWLVDDGSTYHLFFLYASRALHDPERRHYRASVGHAISTDLTSWHRVVDAIVRSDAPAFDDLATWTGSVVRSPDGTWFMFYTGGTFVDGANVQSVGYATSPDLMTWTKNPDNPVLAADPRWYEKLADGQWPDEAFRDPWVFPDPGGNGWHMLVTARGNTGPADDRGVVGHGWSADLRTWEIRPPLSSPGQGFGQLEVTQTAVIEGRPLLMFSCLTKELAASHPLAKGTGGVWVAAAESELGPYDIAGAQQLTDDSLYVGRLLRLRDSDQWVFMAFRNLSERSFVGEITDPQAVSWDGDHLVLTPIRGSAGG